MVTSSRIDAAIPTPMIFTSTAGSNANPSATTIMMAAADTMIRAVEPIPVTTLRTGSPVFSYSS